MPEICWLQGRKRIFHTGVLVTFLTAKEQLEAGEKKQHLKIKVEPKPELQSRHQLMSSFPEINRS